MGSAGNGLRSHADAAPRPRTGAEGAAWRPRLIHPTDGDGARALADLLGGTEVAFVHDTLELQLAELLDTRRPGRRLEGSELTRAVAEHLGPTPTHRYGCWAWFPWSRRLVHLLPEAEFRELRTSRNRNKITAAEQEQLRAATVGVVGLSVGQATAVTLALEEIGGRFRLADFDTLSLSNLNRLRAGVHEIGDSKAAITARAIFEINPYADVSLFAAGITDGNIDEFLGGGGRKLDLLFEECDDLRMKVRLRERARALGIAVLMETSDRGLFDVERFDREPGRPIFHGLAGALEADRLAGMTAYEKVPILLRILGADAMSRRLAASLVDIDTTLKTWPQLASAVALGGAVNADVARRVLLGGLRESGRFYVDLDHLIADGHGVLSAPAEALADAEIQVALAELPPYSPPSTRAASLGEGEARILVAHATFAPSGGNCQPWRFVLRAGQLDLLHDQARSASLLDFQHLASYLALGAAAENLALTARRLGLAVELQPFPDGATVCRADFGGAAVAPPSSEIELAAQIAARLTNRRQGPRVDLEEVEVAALRQVAEVAGARLQLIASDEGRQELGEILGAGDRLRFLSRTLHREMMSEIRWTGDEARRTGDGLDVATLELTPTDLAGMRLLSSWPVMEVLAATGGGQGLEQPSRRAVAAASAIGLLTVPGIDPAAYFAGGRTLERLWLTATARGLAFQPMTALLYLFARLERGGGAGLSDEEAVELRALRGRYRALFDVPADHGELLLFRVARAGPPTARSLRRPIDDLLLIERGGS